MNLKFAFRAHVEPGDNSAENHTHDTLEIVYFLSGTGTSAIDGKKYEITSHTFAIMPPGIIHNQVSKTTTDTLCLGLTNSGLEQSQGFWVDHEGKIKIILESIMKELANQDIAYSIIVDGLIGQAVGLIKRAIKTNAPQDRKQMMVAKALNIIESKAGNLSIDEITGQLFISKDYLRHLFKDYTGQSPVRTIIKARIEHAKSLLRNDELTIGTISEICGFENQYYFSRMFKEITGKSPSQYRTRK
jgi:AraC-like DNA-binding protein